MSSLQFQYSDPFLSSLVSVADEDKAIADVATWGVFTDTQLETIVPLRTYIIVCINSVKAPDDIFNTKLRLYEKELKTALDNAKAVPVAGVTASIFSIAIDRS